MSAPDPILLLDVLGTLSHDPFYEEMPAWFGMTLRELLEAKEPEAWPEFERGEIDEATFLRRFFADGRAYDHAAFVAHVEGCYRWIDGMEELLAELSDAGHAMHALSNYPVWWRRIERRLAASRFLEWSFVSCDLGVRKPDPDAFRIPVARLGVEPGRCLFVDDREENCAAARREGLDAIRFRDARSLRGELVNRGLLRP